MSMLALIKECVCMFKKNCKKFCANWHKLIKGVKYIKLSFSPWVGIKFYNPIKIIHEGIPIIVSDG